MKNTLKELLKNCLRDAKSGRGGLDPNKYPSQVSSRNVVLIETLSVAHIRPGFCTVLVWRTRHPILCDLWR